MSPPHVWVRMAPVSDPSPVVLSLAGDLDSETQRQIVAAADSMLGVRYRMGADSASAMDCSAFVRKAFAMIGFSLPRGTRELIKLGEQIDESDLEPGDLLFYRWRRRGLHVAVYAGNGEIVHASPAAHQVIRTRLTQDWHRRLVSARRLI